ncbi:hypothetical protein PV328_000652 [Microctonus aethiopoides]|uniref:Platelet-derived growth factor (PDGF) family profile domain-containing protein n=1 Tax=Microctonus aethiopoides TaxID=144406 RepID=A0AA39FVC2_9HYME|nr:hypothetical protein PV328_000652 [Microctonus aethiopoides]
MWSDNIKLWIVLTIFHTGKSQYAGYYGNPGAIMFPGPIQSSNNQKINDNSQLSTSTKCQSTISDLDIARELESVETFEDFFNFLRNRPGSGRDFLLSRRSGDENERSNAIVTVQAKCKPVMTLVSFRNENTKPSVRYFPHCTRIERCDGCCNTNLWSCQPVNTTILNHLVIKYEIGNDSKTNHLAEEIIPLEKHLSCQCLCRIKAEHCSKKQQYVEKKCKCECINNDEMSKCNSESQIWNPDTCECNCRNTMICNSGYYFDNQSCRCETTMEQ